MAETIYRGPLGYVKVEGVEYHGQHGALLSYVNPDPRKLHAIDVDGMRELEEGIGAVETAAELEFLILAGAYDPVHAGADITQFAGEPDYAAIKAHLDRGTQLDVRIKALWPKLRTVAVLAGDRYGGSVEWPLFAEWAVAAANARLQFSEVHLGIVPGWNGVLNVLLKSNQANALYMGLTGNPVDAASLQAMGLAQVVVETPPAPDRKVIPPEQWPGLWADHALACDQLLLKAALELATGPVPSARPRDYRLVSADQLVTEVARRTDAAAYRALRAKVDTQYGALGATPEPEALKALNKQVIKELAGLGKPLAPGAVTGLRNYLAEWGRLSPNELLNRFAEPAQAEADLCEALMHTEHRRRGINAVLSKDPRDRVPVFD